MRCSSRVDRLLVDPLGEERHVVGTLFEHLLEDGLQEVLREIGVRGEIRERDLRLDHPEFREVSAGVRILGAKRRPERVDLRQREAVALDVQLARYRQVRLLAEEVLFEVDRRCPRARRIQRIERADAKQLAGAFAIARRDDRRVDPDEAVAVKVTVHRLGDRVAQARDGAERVRARSQMRDGAQVLEGVALLCDRIRLRIVDRADERDARRLNFAILILALRCDDGAFDFARRNRSSASRFRIRSSAAPRRQPPAASRNTNRRGPRETRSRLSTYADCAASRR